LGDRLLRVDFKRAANGIADILTANCLPGDNAQANSVLDPWNIALMDGFVKNPCYLSSVYMIKAIPPCGRPLSDESKTKTTAGREAVLARRGRCSLP
jgi:hypothetical protein